MSLKENLQHAIDEVKAKGIKNIQVENLEAWLAENDAEPSKTDLQTRDLVHQADLAEYHADVEFSLEKFRAVLRISEFIIRGLVIVSGSACVALLALIGKIWNNPGSEGYICTLLDSLKWFGGLTLGALIAAGLFYLTQTSYVERKTNRLGNVFRGITVVVVILVMLGLFKGSIDLSVRLGNQLKNKNPEADVSALETEIDQPEKTIAKEQAGIQHFGLLNKRLEKSNYIDLEEQYQEAASTQRYIFKLLRPKEYASWFSRLKTGLFVMD